MAQGCCLLILQIAASVW